MLTVYGIRQCDTCRRALRWLGERGIDHRFHDVRADGIDAATVRAWLESAYADRLLNRRSITWRGLDDAERGRSGEDLAGLLVDYPTLIKRPVFVDGDVIAVGFDPASQQRLAARTAS